MISPFTMCLRNELAKGLNRGKNSFERCLQASRFKLACWIQFQTFVTGLLSFALICSFVPWASCFLPHICCNHQGTVWSWIDGIHSFLSHLTLKSLIESFVSKSDCFPVGQRRHQTVAGFAKLYLWSDQSGDWICYLILQIVSQVRHQGFAQN